MKAKDLLRAIVCYQIDVAIMGIIDSPDRYVPNYDRKQAWKDWYHDYFRSDEVCILDENSEYLYVFPTDDFETDVLERMNGCWVTNEYGNRVYLFEIE